MSETRGSAHPAEPIRRALAERRQFEIVEAYDCMTARVAQETGFEGILVGVGSIANFAYGLPDIGLVEIPAALELVRRICDCVALPVIADVDDAGTTPMHIRRTVSLAERSGAAGIMVEDTDSTGSKLLWNDDLGDWDWRGATMYSAEIGAARIRSVISSRRDPRFLVVARTDSLRVQPEDGLDGALDRARLYAQAGADVIYMLGQVEKQISSDVVKSIAAPILFAKPGGIDQKEREHLHQAGIDLLLHALVPRLSPYQAYKRTLLALKRAERAVIEGAPWEANREILRTLDLPGWTRLVRGG